MKIVMLMATVLLAGVVNADQYSILSAQGFGFVEASKFPGGTSSVYGQESG